MLKFIRSKGHQQPSAERQKLQKELYAFRKVSQSNATTNAPHVCVTNCLLYTRNTEFLISRKHRKRAFPSIKTVRGVPGTVVLSFGLEQVSLS